MAFARKEISDTSRRMGRKPLGEIAETTTAVLVRFEKSTLAQIEAVAGKNRRAQFIREAVERELDRRRGEGKG